MGPSRLVAGGEARYAAPGGEYTYIEIDVTEVSTDIWPADTPDSHRADGTGTLSCGPGILVCGRVMRLSVFERVEGLTRPRLRLRHKDWAGLRFATAVHVCDNPCCSCTDVQFTCRPDPLDAYAEPVLRQASWVFSLDPTGRCLSDLKADDAHPRSRQLGRAVARELTSEDWDVLWQHFLATKNAAADAADLDTLDAVFPDEVFAGDGAMVLYCEVFPFDPGFTWQGMDEVHWRVDDHHCVAANCTCQNAVLSFLRIRRHGTLLRASATEEAAALYDYRSRAFTPKGRAAPDAPPLDRLVAALREHHP